MAGTTGFFELVAFTDLAAADVFAAVDVSDTTQSPVGSTKKITAASVFAAAQPIAIAAGTVTVSTPVFQATETWNASGVVFTAIKLNVTNTASNTGSLLIDLQVGGSSKFSVDKTGALTVAGATSLQAMTATTVTLAGSLQFTTSGSVPLGGINKSAANGLAMQGVTGSGYDFILFDVAGSAGGAINMPTGTRNVGMPGTLTVGSGLTVSAASGNTASFKTTTMTNGVTLGELGGFTTYGLLAFNGQVTVSTTLGIFGGASGDDKTLNFSVPSGGAYLFTGAASEWGRMISGVFAWGTTSIGTGSSATAGEVTLANAKGYGALSTSGAFLSMLLLDGANRTTLNVNHANLCIANAVTAGTAGSLSEYLVIDTDLGTRKIALLAS